MIVLLAAATAMGCGSGEANAEPPAKEKTAIAESKAAWDPAKVEAFKKAHAEDGRLTPGQKLSRKTQGEQPSK